MTNQTGQTIQGYELLERIGSGGYGAVYRAYQSTVGREVAVKIILPSYANKPAFIRRFEIEAQLVARLEHLHIVPLYDYWRDPNGAYIVMRWLRGGNLRAALENGSFDLEPASLLLDQVAAGLAAAHYQQIVHRDLKPSNILLDEEGNAYLADFGIARDLRRAGSKDGRAHLDSVEDEQILGSIQYLSPEQLLGHEATPLSDIYSLGITLYEILSSQHPFPGLNSVQQLYKQIDEPLPKLDNLEAASSEKINEVIQKATAKNPKHRFKDALAMASAFREAAGLNERSQTADLVELLSRREQEILHLIIAGNTNQQISQTLFLELSTVKWHINRIYKKLGVRSRVQAIVKARDLNLITPPNGVGQSPEEKTTTSLVLPQPTNPYKGIRAFGTADHRDYFGREALIDKLLLRLSPSTTPGSGREEPGTDKDGSERFLAVIGPSGSGKTSLIKAGLIPALWDGRVDGSDKWFIVDLRLSAKPLDDLEISLTRIAADQAGNLRKHLERDSHGLSRAARLILPNDGSELLVVIDQFEELFTLVTHEPIRKHFMNLIHGAVVDPSSRVRVVIGMRADYYDRPLQFPEFGELVRSHLETLLPLSVEELERAIVYPAHRSGVTFEPGLVAAIIEDVSYRPGALPLLQFALAELFEQRDGRMLTHNAYRSLGGATGALARRAEELYQEQDEEGRQAIRQMFLRLVSIGDQVTGIAPQARSPADTRRRVLRSELLSASNHPERLDEIIDTYADYRLLSLDYHPSTRRATVEVAHEAILQEWERLDVWLGESRADLRQHHQLVQATREWIEAGYDPSFLPRGTKLEQFESWASETQLVLTKDERAYLETGIERREARKAAERARNEHEARLERQSTQRLKALVTVMAVALFVAVGLAIAAVSFARRVEQQQRLVEQKDRTNMAQELANAARLHLESDPELGVLLALEAIDITYVDDGSAPTGMEALLYQAVQADQINLSIGFGGEVAYSPDGKTIAIGNPHGVLILWDPLTGVNIQKQSYHRPMIGDIAFSPDSRFLATSNQDRMVKIWDVQSGQNIGYIRNNASTNSIAFHPNGRQLVTAGADGAVRVWDVTLLSNWTDEYAEPIEFSEQTPILEATGEAIDVALSPDGRRAAVLIPGESILIMDLSSRQQMLAIAGVDYSATSVTFSPSGYFVASNSSDLEVTIWEANTGEMILTVLESSAITEIAFSPDGRYLATANESGGTTLWDIQTGQAALRLSGHSSRVDSIAFSPDGSHLATSNEEKTTRIWDINSAGGELYSIKAHDGKVHDAVFNADGTKIASAGEDGAVKVWVAATGRLQLDLPGQSDWVHFPAFSPDGQKLAAANRNGGITVWDANTGDELLSVYGDAEAFTAITFNADGSRLAAGGQDGTAHIWDAATGERLTDIQYDGDTITELFFTPEGKQIRTYDLGGQQIAWDAITGKRLDVDQGSTWGDGVYWGGNNFYWDVEFTPDGRLGAAACSAAVVYRVGNKLERKTELYSLESAGRKVTGVALNPDGSLLATSNSDGEAKLWDLRTGEEIATLSDNQHSLGGVDISPDGRYLVTAGSDGIVSVYVISIEELTELARSRLSRGFTREECQTYLHVPVCPDE